MLGQFTYKRATSIKEAVDASSRPGARIHAGGTDLLGCLRDGVFTASTVVSISGIKELKGISARPGGGLRIGALTTLTEVAENKQVLDGYSVLAQAAAAAGTIAATLTACGRAEKSVSPWWARTSSTASSAAILVLSSILRTRLRRWWRSTPK
jgi:hypothetical protein